MQNKQRCDKIRAIKMGAIETNVRRLPENHENRIFESCYQSPLFVLVTTTKCPQEVLERLVSLFESDRLNWLIPLNTFTSRELLLGQLNQSSNSLPNVVFKKSRFGHSSHASLSSPPGSVANEIRSNLLLNAVVQKQIKSGELPPPDGFSSLSVHVEQPLGILVDKQNRSKYSVFLFESGFDLGEILQYTDPPMQGAVNYNPRDWRVFCAIKDVLDRIAQAALQKGLTMQDYDIHQVLYRTDENARSLELILIDSERFRIGNNQ